MRRAIGWVALAALAVLQLTAARAGASITAATCQNDGDHAINCVANWGGPNWGWDAVNQQYDMTITGAQFWGPGHMNGTITTNNATDPTLFIENSVDNDTSFAWGAYEVDVLMPNLFTLSNAQANLPSNWAPTVGPRFFNNALNEYEYVMTFTGPSPIQIGDTFDFQYKISFTGLTSYQFTEQLSPVPEPASLGILGLGAFGLMSSRRMRRAA